MGKLKKLLYAGAFFAAVSTCNLDAPAEARAPPEKPIELKQKESEYQGRKTAYQMNLEESISREGKRESRDQQLIKIWDHYSENKAFYMVLMIPAWLAGEGLAEWLYKKEKKKKRRKVYGSVKK
jgi:hypothetical protein